MIIDKQLIILLIWSVTLTAACTPAANNFERAATGMQNAAGSSTPNALHLDAAAFAADQDLSLEEASRRLAYQETIGAIQPLLMSDLPTTFGGLWVEHQPIYRIVIALTQGDEQTIRPYIEDKDWAGFVEVKTVGHTLQDLLTDQKAAGQAAQKINVSATTAVDIINNRVELIVGNPELFQKELAQAGIELPYSVVVIATDPGGDLPESNRGVLFEVTAADGQTIYLPKQPPTNVSMDALMEGTLMEIDGCLRLADEHYADGFMVIWPYETDIRVADNQIEILNGDGQMIARVGERMRAGGGAMESSLNMSRFDETIPGMPVEGCPGPYWVAGELETLVEQQIPDVYFQPFSSGSQILAWFVNQSQPSPESEFLSGKLLVDDEGCLRIDQHLLIWPPGVYLREEPLRIIDSALDDIALVGDTIQVTGGEKHPDDYRYFDNKVNCTGPYWGVNTVSITP